MNALDFIIYGVGVLLLIVSIIPLFNRWRVRRVEYVRDRIYFRKQHGCDLDFEQYLLRNELSFWTLGDDDR